MTVKLSQDVLELLQKLPKTDLHCHLDGSLRPQTLLDLAKKSGLKLPSGTIEGLNTLVFKDTYANLEEYLKTFEYSTAVLQTPEALEQTAYELAEDVQKEGGRYLEVRFAPQLHMHAGLDMTDVLKSVNRGLDRARQRFNSEKCIVSGNEPPFLYGIIVCALRSFGSFSEYYKNFIESLQFSAPSTIYGLGSLELAKGAVKVRDELNIPIVGFDLAGAEAGNPARHHREAFQYAHAHFMQKTVHAGEAYGAPSIFQAITELHANRLGHGYYLFDPDKIDDPEIVDRNQYIHALVQYIADRRITIEVCLTSNLQTNTSLKSLKTHSFAKMMAQDLSATICTDNRTVSKTSITRELTLLLENFDITPEQLKNTVFYGFKRSFYPGPYTEKRQYVRQCLDYYETLVRGTALDAEIQPQTE